MTSSKMTSSKTPNHASALAARRADRERDGLQAMREYQAEQARIDANTARLRAARLAKEAADTAIEQAVEPKPVRGLAKAARRSAAQDQTRQSSD